MKLVVTGSGGFIGSAVGRIAAAYGHDVTGISRSSQAAPTWPGRHVPADVVEDDLTDLFSDLRPDSVVHAAGPASVAGSFQHPLETMRASALGWGRLLDALRRGSSGTRAYLLSSAAVYGNPGAGPTDESAQRAPISPYGFHKLLCETISESYRQSFDLQVTDCRVFSVFGPAQRRLLVWELYEQLAKPADGPVALRGTGQETRDYLYVDDLASALVGLATAPDQVTAINIASGRSVSVLELVAVLQDVLGTTRAVEPATATPMGDPVSWEADVSLLRRLLPGLSAPSLPDRVRECAATWTAESA